MYKLLVLSAVVVVALGATFSGDPRSAVVLKLESDITPEGNYNYLYETDNGISGAQSGVLKQIGKDFGMTASGTYKFVTPDGVEVVMNYVADENGYQATGNSIPTPPPIPVAIQKALDWIVAHPYVEKP